MPSAWTRSFRALDHRASERLEELDEQEALRRLFDDDALGRLDRGDQAARVLRHARHLDRGAAVGEPRRGAGDEPGAGRVDVGDAGKIEDDAAGDPLGRAFGHGIERFGGVDDPRPAGRQAGDIAVDGPVERAAQNRFSIGHASRVQMMSLGMLEPRPAAP